MAQRDGLALRKEADWETLYWWRRDRMPAERPAAPAREAEGLRAPAAPRPDCAPTANLVRHGVPANDRRPRDRDPLGALYRERRDAALAGLMSLLAATAPAALALAAASALGSIGWAIASLGAIAGACGLAGAARQLRHAQARLRLLLLRAKSLS